MARYAVNGYKNVRLEFLVIEADSPEEAKVKYTQMVRDGEVRIGSEDWHMFSPEDCNEPDEMSNRLRYFKDGDKWCCVYDDFINLQESPAGFGITKSEAQKSLAKVSS